MAAGDILFFNKFKYAQVDGSANAALSSMPVDFDTDTIRVAVMKTTYSADVGDASTQEHWDDISASQVATGTAYTGPIALAGKAVTLASGVVKFDATDIIIAQDATGFTDGQFIVFYKDSGVAGTSPLICYGDLGTAKSIQAGSLTFQWNAGGIFTLT